jgi:hypothetical protein
MGSAMLNPGAPNSTRRFVGLEVARPRTYFAAGTLHAAKRLFAAVGSAVEVEVLGICGRVGIVALGTMLYVLVGVAIASVGG